MMNIELSRQIRLFSAAQLASIIVSCPDLLFKYLCKFVVIFRTNRIWQAAGKTHTLSGAVFALIHVGVNRGYRALKPLAAMLTNQCRHFLTTSKVVAFFGAVYTFSGFKFAQFGFKYLSTLGANSF